MSITRRIREVVRSNLNALLDRAAQLGAAGELQGFSDDELERELAQRKASRRQSDVSLRIREELDRDRKQRDSRDAEREAARKAAAAEALAREEARREEARRYASQHHENHERERAERERDKAKLREAAAGAERARKERIDAAAAEERARGAAADRARAAEVARARAADVRASEEARARAEAHAAAEERAREEARIRARARRGMRHDVQLAHYYALLELPYGAAYVNVKVSYRRLMRKYHPDLYGQDVEKQRLATQLAQSLTQAHNELELVLIGGPNRSR